MATTDTTAYLDPKPLLDPSFTPYQYAHDLVLRTNNASDTPLDLSTPLARVLFDTQEADTLIDSLATKYAAPLVIDTGARADAAARVLDGVEARVAVLTEGYERLKKEVGERYAQAEETRVVAERMLKTLRLGRAVQRALVLGRQVESLIAETKGNAAAVNPGSANRATVEAARTLVGLKGLLARTGKGEEGEGLARVGVVNALRADILVPTERVMLATTQQVVREFSMSSLLSSSSGTTGQASYSTASTQTFAQVEETRNKTTAALSALYLLSTPLPIPGTTPEDFHPRLLIEALNSYLHAAITSSIAALARALATLPTLDRTLLEISARCQNVVALERLLSTTKPPVHPLLAASNNSSTDSGNLLAPLLRHLDTASLPSYFWRTMASQLSPRVSEILARGGVSARTLRSSANRVRTAVRECVDRGSKAPTTAGAGGVRTDGTGQAPSWEREAAVMVQSVVGPLMK